MSSSFALPEPLPSAGWSPIRARAPRPSAMWGAAVLCTAILLAATGTVDPLWWHLHFSRLGMFADASGFTFNGGVIASGLVIAAAGIPLAVNLARAQAEGRIVDARAARLLPPLLVTLGICLALIGVIPLTLNEFLHDRAANGVMLSFLGMVIVSRRTLRELPAFLGRYALTTVAVLVIGIVLMFTGILNLAAFEVLAFGGVLSWVHLLERSVARLGAIVPIAPILGSATEGESEPHGRPQTSVAHRDDLVRRGGRRRRVASTISPARASLRVGGGSTVHRPPERRTSSRGRSLLAARATARNLRNGIRTGAAHTPPSIERV